MPNVKTIIDDHELREALARVGALDSPGGPLLQALGDDLVELVRQGFVTGTDPYGIPWAPLKVRVGRPLRDKGHLMDSITSKVEDNSVVVGTNYGPLADGKSVAGVHQFGATIVATGKSWEVTRHSYRTGQTTSSMQPGKLVFAGPDGRLIFAQKVTIPARRMFPLDGMPPQWSSDLLETAREHVEGVWGNSPSHGSNS